MSAGYSDFAGRLVDQFGSTNLLRPGATPGEWLCCFRCPRRRISTSALLISTMSPTAFEAMSTSRSLPDEKRSAVWNKGPISIDLRTVGVELEVSTCFLADGIWSVGSVYDASALNHILSTAIGCGARRFGRPRVREEGGKFE